MSRHEEWSLVLYSSLIKPWSCCAQAFRCLSKKFGTSRACWGLRSQRFLHFMMACENKVQCYAQTWTEPFTHLILEDVSLKIERIDNVGQRKGAFTKRLVECIAKIRKWVFSWHGGSGHEHIVGQSGDRLKMIIESFTENCGCKPWAFWDLRVCVHWANCRTIRGRTWNYNWVFYWKLWMKALGLLSFEGFAASVFYSLGLWRTTIGCCKCWWVGWVDSNIYVNRIMRTRIWYGR